MVKIKYVGTEELFLGCEANGMLSKDCKSWLVSFEGVSNHPMIGVSEFMFADWEFDWTTINYSLIGGSNGNQYEVSGKYLFERLCYDGGDYPMVYVYPIIEGWMADTGWFYFIKDRMVFDSMAAENCKLYPLSKILTDWWNKHVNNS